MTILASLPALAPVAAAQNDLLSRIFVFDRYGELLQMLQNSIFAGAVLGLIGGFVGIFVMMRDHAFAVHGVSEMSFAGAALALLLGYDVVTGSMVGSIASALLIAFLGSKASNSNSVIGRRQTRSTYHRRRPRHRCRSAAKPAIAHQQNERRCQVLPRSQSRLRC